MSIQFANRRSSVIIMLKNKNVHSATNTSHNVLVVSVRSALEMRRRKLVEIRRTKSVFYVKAVKYQMDVQNVQIVDVTYA